MKKTIQLFLLLCLCLHGYSQPCFTVSSTGFSTVSTGLNSISVVDANVVWAAARSGAPPTNRQVTYSVNGGVSWTPKTVTLNPGNAGLAISNLCAVSSTKAYISANGVAGTLGGIWVTTDAGTTWTKQTTALYNDATDSFPNFVHFFDMNNGVTMGDPAGGSFEIYTTSDGGNNWSRVSSANMPLYRSDLVENEYGLTNVFTTTGNTLWLGTSYGRILRTTDKGLTWTAINTPLPDFGSGKNGPTGYNINMSWKNDMVGSLTDSDYNYYRTTDGGQTWTQDSNGIPRQFDIAYVPGTASTVVCIGEDLIDGFRSTSYSYDDGLTWSNCPETSGSMVSPLVILSPTVGYISGFTTSATVGGVFRLTGSQINPLSNDQFSANKLFSIAPNPSNGLYELTGININQVQVIDVLGKVIANNSYNSLSKVSLDIQNANSGIYVVKVTNDLGNTSLIKVVKQ